MQFLSNTTTLIREHLTLLDLCKLMVQCLHISSILAQFLIAPLQFSRTLIDFSFQLGRIQLHCLTLTSNKLRIVYGDSSLSAQCFNQFNVMSTEATCSRITYQESSQSRSFARAQLNAQKLRTGMCPRGTPT